MKKIMIVDDEVLVRFGIQSLVKWEQYGYAIVCDAADGEEALKKIEQFRPDVVLTDLMMEPMDGFELITRCRELYPQVQFIVLSNYNDFDNVRKAMKIGAYDYVFKLTVKADELVKLINEACASMKPSDSTANQENIVQKNLDVIKKDLLGKVLNQETFLEKNMEALKALPLGITFDCPYSTLAVKLDNFRIVRKKGDFIELELLVFTMQNIIQELFSRVYGAEVFQQKECDFVVVLNRRENQDYSGFIETVVKEFEILVKCVRQYYGLEISGALSREHVGLEQLKEAVEQNGETLEQRFFQESGKLHRYKIVYQEEVAIDELYEPDTLGRLALNGDFYGMQQYLSSYLEYLAEKKRWKPAQIRHLLRELYKRLNAGLARHKIDIEYIVDKNGANLENAINDYTYYDRIRQAVMELFHQYEKEYETSRGKSSRREIAQVKSFVQNHMQEELSLSRIAAIVNMSESHFSHLFKKDMGISFIEYVNQVRMDKAAELLHDPHRKINEIGEMVGIFNPNYFSTQFKKKVGKSPNEYRQSLEIWNCDSESKI